MKRTEIEMRIRVIERLLSECKDSKMIPVYNRILEKLIMLEAEDE